MTKVSIIGAGAVGTTCADCIARKNIAHEIVLLDSVYGVAESKALDLWESSSIQGFDTRIHGTTNDYSKTENSDIVVIVSGSPRKPEMSRDDLIAINAKVVKDVTKKVIEYSPNSIIIVVSNPLDVMCYATLLTSKFESHRIMGMSGLLDVARYKAFIADALNISPKDIQAIILGGHGKTMLPLPRYTTIGGISVYEFLTQEQLDPIIERTRMGGDELVKLLGRSLWYAAGSAISEMVESIILDQKRIFPISAYLNGEYGLNDIFLGVPVVLGKEGIQKVIEIDLNENEKHLFLKSEKYVRETNEIMKTFL